MARRLKQKAKRSIRKIRARQAKQLMTLAIEDSAEPSTPAIRRYIRIKRKPTKTKQELDLLKKIEETKQRLEELLGQRVDDDGQVLIAAADASQVVPPAGDVGTAPPASSGGPIGPRYPTRPASKAHAQALAHARPKAVPVPVTSEGQELGYFIRNLLQEFNSQDPPDDGLDDHSESNDGSVADDEGGAFDAASNYPDLEDLEDDDTMQ